VFQGGRAGEVKDELEITDDLVVSRIGVGRRPTGCWQIYGELSTAVVDKHQRRPSLDRIDDA